jgi:hypothetical protein
MSTDQGQYEVLSPWAEADPIPYRGLTAGRLSDLRGKKIGLFHNIKRAGEPILKVVQKRLAEQYHGVEFSWYKAQTMSVAELEPQNVERFREWIRGVDAAVLAVAD